MSEGAVSAGGIREGSETEAAPAQPSAEPAIKDFSSLFASVEAAATGWGVRRDSPEGQFLSAMLGAIGWSGRMTEAARLEFRALFQQQRETVRAEFQAIAGQQRDVAALELNRASELAKAANAAVMQARNAQIGLAVRQESVVADMMSQTLPAFMQKMRDAVFEHEKAVREKAGFRRFVIIGAAMLALCLGGYGLRGWEDAGVTSALDRCLAHSFSAENHLYCDITNFAPKAP